MKECFADRIPDLNLEKINILIYLYKNLEKAAIRENKLRHYFAARLSIVTLEDMRYAIEMKETQYRPSYLIAEWTDPVEDIIYEYDKIMYPGSPVG